MKFALAVLLLAAPAFARDWRAGRWAARQAAVEARIARKQAMREVHHALRDARRYKMEAKRQALREKLQYKMELRRELRGRPDTTGMKRIL